MTHLTSFLAAICCLNLEMCIHGAYADEPYILKINFETYESEEKDGFNALSCQNWLYFVSLVAETQSNGSYFHGWFWFAILGRFLAVFLWV
jgi:hypothetical protein